MTNRQFKNNLNAEIDLVNYFYKQFIESIKEEDLKTVLIFKHNIDSFQESWLQRRFVNGVTVNGKECTVNSPIKSTT